MTLWGGRFSEAADQLFQRVNRSLNVDYRLAEQDIIGSVAWSKALLSVNVLTEEEQQELEKVLNKLLAEVLMDSEILRMAPFEDIHSWVESRLIEEVGALGKKLHTGRSRNDQVTTDMKLWCKQQGLQLLDILILFQHDLLRLAESHTHTIMPGYTHLQRAQPITFAHWCLAYVEMLHRDTLRLQDALFRLDESPLGSGALAGTAYSIDRQQLAQWLGFHRATQNSLDAVSDRDYLIELMGVASLNMVHLSRFAEDLIFFNSNEAQFVEFSDRVTSGSSLMPQKKNPDALELIRGKSGAVIGASFGLMTTFKGLPLAYNKDMQEDKATFFNAIDSWSDALHLAKLVLQNIQVNGHHCREAALKGYLNATELADYLVLKGIPFREAHHLVGECVLSALQANKLLEELTLDELQQFSPCITSDVYYYLTLESCLGKRNVQGGTAITRTIESIANARQRLVSLSEDKTAIKG